MSFVILAGFVILGWLLILQDLRTMRVGNTLMFFLWCLGIMRAFAMDFEWSHAFINTVVLYVFMGVFKEVYRRMRGREGIGMGDIKLFAALGPWVDLHMIPVFFTCVGIVGCVWGFIHRMRGRKGYYPYAPSIFLGYYLTCHLAAQGETKTLCFSSFYNFS